MKGCRAGEGLPPCRMPPATAVQVVEHFQTLPETLAMGEQSLLSTGR